MPLPFPEPTAPGDDQREVLLGYLAYFRSVVLDKMAGLDERELRRSRLPSGWSPLELLQHLTHVERRWLEWGFEGRTVDDPWADQRDGRWHVDPDATLERPGREAGEQAARSEAVVRGHDLGDSAHRASAGTATHRPSWAGSCCTCSRSTPATSATSTSSASSTAGRVARPTRSPVPGVLTYMSVPGRQGRRPDGSGSAALDGTDALGGEATAASRAAAVSSSVSVRSGARKRSAKASDFLPSPTCSPV